MDEYIDRCGRCKQPIDLDKDSEYAETQKLQALIDKEQDDKVMRYDQMRESVQFIEYKCEEFKDCLQRMEDEERDQQSISGFLVDEARLAAFDLQDVSGSIVALFRMQVERMIRS